MATTKPDKPDPDFRVTDHFVGDSVWHLCRELLEGGGDRSAPSRHRAWRWQSQFFDDMNNWARQGLFGPWLYQHQGMASPRPDRQNHGEKTGLIAALGLGPQ